MSGGIQTVVNDQPAPGIAGDKASFNPVFTFDAGPGGLVSGGCNVGRFAWVTQPNDANGSPAIALNSGTGSVAGFVPREQQGLNTIYLQDASQFIPIGFQMSLMIGGDFWVLNDGVTQALPGQKAYANFSNGKVTFANTGTPTVGGTSSSSSIAAETFSVTGSITGAQLTVTAVISGTVYPGSTISGGTTVSGTTIVSQASGTTGGVGIYNLSIPEQTVTSQTISGTYGLMTVGGTVAGTFAVNDILAATGSVVTGTTITALGTGTGGAGTYVVNNNTVVSAQAINISAVNVETKWYARSSGLAGEVVKISNFPLG